MCTLIVLHIHKLLSFVVRYTPLNKPRVNKILFLRPLLLGSDSILRIIQYPSIYQYAKGKFVLAPTLTNHLLFLRSFACTLYVIIFIYFINFSTLLFAY